MRFFSLGFEKYRIVCGRKRGLLLVFVNSNSSSCLGFFFLFFNVHFPCFCISLLLYSFEYYYTDFVSTFINVSIDVNYIDSCQD